MTVSLNRGTPASIDPPNTITLIIGTPKITLTFGKPPCVQSHRDPGLGRLHHYRRRSVQGRRSHPTSRVVAWTTPRVQGEGFEPRANSNPYTDMKVNLGTRGRKFGIG